MTKKTIHVHIHEPQRTTDAEGGEGRWVTIMGAHVHIGEGGKIDKGPAALVNKSEHGAHAHQHRVTAQAHAESKKAKGDQHPDAPHHHAAAMAHYEAARERDNADHFAERGDIKEARKHHDAAEKHATAAKAHEAKVGSGQAAEPAKFEMPEKHQALHSDAADDVRGSEKHQAEHNRLLNLYHSSKADWERQAVNRLISHNAAAGAQHRATGLHHMAMSASERAKRTDAPADHFMASQHIQNAIDAHGKAGGVGYAAKQAELQKAKKLHDAAAAKAGKKAKRVDDLTDDPDVDVSPESLPGGGKYPNAGVGTDLKKGAKPVADHDGTVKKHKAEGDAHDDVGRRGADIKERGFVHQKTDKSQEGRTVHHYAHPDGSRAVVTHEKVDNGYEPARHEVSSLVNTMNKGKKPAAAGKRGKPAGAASGLDAIAARKVKKAAEEAADQDPKHKK
jgi:hypothetical protein